MATFGYAITGPTQNSWGGDMDLTKSVSYTHLTLPTSYSV